MLIAALLAAILAPSRAAPWSLKCYKEKAEAPVPCPQGLSIEYDVEPPAVMGYREHPIIAFTLSSPFLPARVDSSHVPHANVHECRLGVSTCSPFYVDRLLTSTPNTPANLTHEMTHKGPPFTFNFSSRMKGLAPGAYQVFSHVYLFEMNETARSTDLHPVRWDVALYSEPKGVLVTFPRQKMVIAVSIAFALLGCAVILLCSLRLFDTRNGLMHDEEIKKTRAAKKFDKQRTEFLDRLAHSIDKGHLREFLDEFHDDVMHDHRKSNSSSHLREEMHLALQKDIAVKRLPNLRRREKLPYYALTAYRAFERATTIQRISVRLDPGSETNTATISKNTSSATTVHDIIFDSTDEPHALFDPHDRCQDAGGARSAENRRGSMLKQLGVSEGSTSTLVEENGNVHDDFNNAERVRVRSLGALYLMAALEQAPYVPDRPLHRFSLDIFQIIGTKLYRLFLIGAAFGHLSVALWEPPSLAAVDRQMHQSALCVGVELCFCSVYVLHFYTRLSIEASQTCCSMTIRRRRDKIFVAVVFIVFSDCVFTLFRYLICNPLERCDAIANVPRISRPFRVYLVIYVIPFVRSDVQRIWHSLFALVDVALVAGFVLAVFAFFAVINFGGLDEGPTASFATFDKAVRSLFILLTSEGFEMVWSTYALRSSIQYRYSSMLFFTLFTMLSLFIVAMFLSSVYSSYQKYRDLDNAKQLKNELLNITACLVHLGTVKSDGDLVLLRDDFLELLEVAKPAWTRPERELAFQCIALNKPPLGSMDSMPVRQPAELRHEQLASDRALSVLRTGRLSTVSEGQGPPISEGEASSKASSRSAIQLLSLAARVWQQFDKPRAGLRVWLAKLSIQQFFFLLVVANCMVLTFYGPGGRTVRAGWIWRHPTPEIVDSIDGVFAVLSLVDAAAHCVASIWSEHLVAALMFTSELIGLRRTGRYGMSLRMPPNPAVDSTDLPLDARTLLDLAICLISSLVMWLAQAAGAQVNASWRTYHLIVATSPLLNLRLPFRLCRVVLGLAALGTAIAWREAMVISNLRIVRVLRLFTVSFRLSACHQREKLIAICAHEKLIRDTKKIEGAYELGATADIACASADDDRPPSHLSWMIERHLESFAASFFTRVYNVKGVLATAAHLIEVVFRMLVLVFVCTYPFAIIGMELFHDRKAECNKGAANETFEFWFLCSDYDYRYANFQRMDIAMMALYQAFYTGDVCSFVQATSSVQAEWLVVLYWGGYFILIRTVVMDVLISNVIETFERRLKQSDEKWEKAVEAAAAVWHQDVTKTQQPSTRRRATTIYRKI